MHPEYTEVVRYSPLIMGYRWVWFHFCELVTLCAIGINFMPRESRFDGRPLLLATYRFVVHYIAFFACNWRARLPSLDLEFMGFKKALPRWHIVREEDRLDSCGEVRSDTHASKFY
jgi:hypothetical protein